MVTTGKILSLKRMGEPAPLAMLFIGLVALALIYAAHVNISHVLREQRSYASTLRQASSALATGHLKLEEYLAGDQTIPTGEVGASFDRSLTLVEKWLATAADDFPELVADIEAVLPPMVALRELTTRRLAEMPTSGAGEEVEQRYDVLYEQIVRIFDRIDADLVLRSSREEMRQHRLHYAISFLWVILIGSVLFALMKNSATRETTTQELEEKAQLLIASQRIAHLGVYVFDVSSGLWRGSHVLHTIFGTPDAEEAHDIASWLAVVSPDQREEMRLYLTNHVLGEKKSFDKEYRIVREVDGVERWVHGRGELIFDEAGKPIKMIGAILDITERKKREEELEKFRERVDLASAVGGVGIWDWNPATNHLDWNDPVYRLFGVIPEETKPDFALVTNLVHPDDRERFETAVNNALRHHTPFDIEYRVRRKDGQERVCHAIGAVTFDKADTPVRMMGTVIDITARKEQEQSLVAARKEAERANKAQSIFLSSMSHEIRTPLTSVMGFARLLLSEEGSSLNDFQRGLLERITDSGDRLLTLLSNVLELSRIESEQVELRCEDREVEPAAKEALAALQPLMERMGVYTVLGNAGESCIVRADVAHLESVLKHLVSNGVKYSSKGKKVTLGWERRANHLVRITVSDTGCGIPESKIKNLFLPFNRLGKEGHNIEGAGVGLLIAKKLVESMGGSIGVESAVERGSTFYIDLPAGAEPAQTSGGKRQGENRDHSLTS